MRSDFHIMANQLLWHNWLQYIQQQNNEMAQQEEEGLYQQVRKDEPGQVVCPKQRSRRDCARLFAVQSRCRKKESDMKENLLCRGPSCCISSSLMWALQSPKEEGMRRSVFWALRGYPHSILASKDFTHPNGEMNSTTDYMSCTFYGSSLSDAQVERSLNTGTHSHKHRQN